MEKRGGGRTMIGWKRGKDERSNVTHLEGKRGGREAEEGKDNRRRKGEKGEEERRLDGKKGKYERSNGAQREG